MSLSLGIVTEHYYPVLGGVSENVHHTARDLIARGHRVRIITPAVSGGRSAHLPTPDGIPVTNVGRAITLYGNGAQTNAAIGMHLLRDLGDVLRGDHFDILQLHSPLNFTLPPLAALLSTCPCVCSPVSRASFGITLLEAMATTKPIVATDNIGYRGLLGPEEGLLVPLDVEAFADGIIRLRRDDDLRAAMGAAGRRKARLFGWPVVVDRLLEYFGEILARA